MPVVIISGGGSGIGQATAREFATAGWTTVLLGRNASRLEATAQSLPTPSHILPVDLSDSQETHQKLTEWLQSHSELQPDIRALVNNAGLYERREFMASGDEFWLSQFEANFFSAVRLTRHLWPVFVENGGGSVVMVASTLGQRPVASTSVYAASKAALINLTETLALEGAGHGIRVNCVSPGIVETPIQSFYQDQSEKAAQIRTLAGSLHPLGRVGRPEEVAFAIHQFCRPESSWTTGANLRVDGGIHLTSKEPAT